MSHPNSTCESHLNTTAHLNASHPVEAETLMSKYSAVCRSQSFSNLSFVEFLWQAYPQYMHPNKLLRLYMPPVLLFLGTFGNIFSFLILIKKRKSTYMYLAILAVMDLIVLYIGLLRLWIAEFTIDLQDTADWLCKAVNYIGPISSDASVWMIVAVTIERFIAVFHPMTVPRICNIKRTKWIILVIISFMFAINTPILWAIELKSTVEDGRKIYSCGARDRYKNIILNIWPWIDAAIYSFVPCVIIIILNALIIKGTIAATKRRISLQGESLVKNRKASTSTNASQHSKAQGSIQEENLGQKFESNCKASVNTHFYKYSRCGSLQETNLSNMYASNRRASEMTTVCMYNKPESRKASTSTNASQQAQGSIQEENLGQKFESNRKASVNTHFYKYSRCGSPQETNLSQRYASNRRASEMTTVCMYNKHECNLSGRYASIRRASSNVNMYFSGRKRSHAESKFPRRFGPIRTASTNTITYRYGSHEPSLSERFGSICSIDTNKSDKRGSRSESRENGRLVFTLLTVSAAFLITTLPMVIVQIAVAFYDFKKDEDPVDYALHIAKFTLARTVVELLMYVNHSINFVLYCANGSMFRQEFKSTILSSPLACLRQSLKRVKSLKCRNLETKL